MKVMQLSVFLENREGRLAEAVGLVAEAGINIRALSLAETADFGVIRMIVDTPDKAITALKAKSIIVKTTDVIAVEVEDKPGGLKKVLDVFHSQGINIEYMYACVEKNNSNAVMLLRVENPEAALEKVKDKVKILKAEEVYEI
ncbi:MAG: ACT domain-containing protein [Spirochaetia bacterium]|nr:ACT domain-containing protein [Spirochaetia bacterium]